MYMYIIYKKAELKKQKKAEESEYFFILFLLTFKKINYFSVYFKAKSNFNICTQTLINFYFYPILQSQMF